VSDRHRERGGFLQTWAVIVFCKLVALRDWSAFKTALQTVFTLEAVVLVGCDPFAAPPSNAACDLERFVS
jgi:hypothetical protein